MGGAYSFSTAWGGLDDSLPPTRREGNNERSIDMLFEVLMDGKVKASTEHLDCIPTPEILRDMERAGYSFRLNGKRCKAKDAAAAKNNGRCSG